MSGAHVDDEAGDAHWMAQAIALGEAARGSTAPNPHVGCVVVANGEVVGRGATAPGGRPHAEAVALAQAAEQARGATLYTSLEPCAHLSTRGPACADLVIAAGVARVVAALRDPDRRTGGLGFERLRAANIAMRIGVGSDEASNSLAGYLSRVRRGRPWVTLKLAQSIDGRIAMASGESRWITGEPAREHAHRERARADAILVGRGTFEADAPRLDVRIPGCEHLSPRRLLLTRGEAPEAWTALGSPEAISDLSDVNDLLVEGGGKTAAAFLNAGLVDRLMIYTAPLLIGGDGRAGVAALGLDDLASAHGCWMPAESLRLGSDRLDIYVRA